MDLTHINKDGYAKMVDVTDKDVTFRKAIAHASIKMKRETIERITNNQIKKGDVLSVAQVAGIMGVKKTSELIPMAHPLLISGADIEYTVNEESIDIYCTVKVSGQTGVEMEALTGASICALTIYDMVKAIDKDMEIGEIHLLEKTGGKSGLYVRRI